MRRVHQRVRPLRRVCAKLRELESEHRRVARSSSQSRISATNSEIERAVVTENGGNEFHCKRAKNGGQRSVAILLLPFSPHLVTLSRFSKSGRQASSIGEKGRDSQNTLVGHCRKLAKSKRTWNARRCPLEELHERFLSGIVTRSAGAVISMD